jgi:hypothetical protein
LSFRLHPNDEAMIAQDRAGCKGSGRFALINRTASNAQDLVFAGLVADGAKVEIWHANHWAMSMNTAPTPLNKPQQSYFTASTC